MPNKINIKLDVSGKSIKEWGLSIGDTFALNNEIYMLVPLSYCCSRRFNTVRLQDGSVHDIDEDTEVIKVILDISAKFKVEGC